MKDKISKGVKNRENEKGAALVMALLVSFLMLVASAGLLMEASMNSANVTDATSEQQAYSAAESGIQAAVFVLRDNVTLATNKLLIPNPPGCSTAATQPELCKANRIDYLKALQPYQSNLTTSGQDATPRLSRWMNYDATSTDRVVMNAGGFGYSLNISDPDHTGALVTYSSDGTFMDCDLCSDANPFNDIPNQKTYGDATNGFVVKYVAQSSTQVDTTAGSAATDFGTITLTKYGNGALILNDNRFELDISMTQPYLGTRVIRGWIEQNACTAGVCSTPYVIFDSQTFTLQGSQIDLLSTGGNAISSTYLTGPPPGFESALNASSGGAPNLIHGTISSPEPIRLLITSTGYGPRGSTKQLQAIIRKNFFDGLTAPATLTLIGPATAAACASPTCVPAIPASTFHFALGNSNAMLYSGQDAVSTDIIPPIGAIGGGNVDSILNEIDAVNRSNTITGTPSDITRDTPAWLSSPTNLDNAVKSLQSVASASGRYFPSGQQPTTFGNNTAGTGITFCDGNCELSGNGGGIMVVTGTLTLRGNFSFKGIILVTGQGGVQRQGAGNGDIQGNMIVAPYANSSVLPATDPVGSTFLAPQYDLSGGGNSTIQYNSTALNSGLVAVSNFVLGVKEN